MTREDRLVALERRAAARVRRRKTLRYIAEVFATSEHHESPKVARLRKEENQAERLRLLLWQAKVKEGTARWASTPP